MLRHMIRKSLFLGENWLSNLSNKTCYHSKPIDIAMSNRKRTSSPSAMIFVVDLTINDCENTTHTLSYEFRGLRCTLLQL